MVEKCMVCGKEDWMGKDCKFCYLFHCAKHILPENHNCAGVERYREFSNEMRKKGKATIMGATEEAIKERWV